MLRQLDRHLDLGESHENLSSLKYFTVPLYFSEQLLIILGAYFERNIFFFNIYLVSIRALFCDQLTIQEFKMADHNLPRVTDEFVNYNATHEIPEKQSVNNNLIKDLTHGILS